jgi:hypothetical protein
MSSTIKKKWSLGFALLITAGVLQAASQDSLKKTYTLVNLQEAVYNSSKCQALYAELETFTKTPIELQFSTKRIGADLEVQESTGKVVRHSYGIARQSSLEHTVHRTGLGLFEVNKEQIHYVIEVSADTQQADFKYLYPIILSGDNGHCYYTALVKPSAETVAAFKKNMVRGLVTKKTDLTSK